MVAHSVQSFFPFREKTLMSLMNIHERSVQRSFDILLKIFDRLDQRLNTHSFLVGDTFTAADLTAASLLAPLVGPKQHPFAWPEKFPDEMEKIREQMKSRPFFIWVEKMYREYR